MKIEYTGTKMNHLRILGRTCSKYTDVGRILRRRRSVKYTNIHIPTNSRRTYSTKYTATGISEKLEGIIYNYSDFLGGTPEIFGLVSFWVGLAIFTHEHINEQKGLRPFSLIGKTVLLSMYFYLFPFTFPITAWILAQPPQEKEETEKNR